LLGENAVEDAGVAALAPSAHLGGLRHLDLSAAPITEAGVRALIASRPLSGLTSLVLTRGCITAATESALVERRGRGTPIAGTWSGRGVSEVEATAGSRRSRTGRRTRAGASCGPTR